MHVHSSLTATSAAAKEAKEAPPHEPLVAKVAILLADGALAILVAAGEDEPTLAHEVDHIVLCWLAFVRSNGCPYLPPASAVTRRTTLLR